MTPTPEQIEAEMVTARTMYRDVRLSDAAAKPIMVNDLATALATARLEGEAQGREKALDETIQIAMDMSAYTVAEIVAAILALKETDNDTD